MDSRDIRDLTEQVEMLGAALSDLATVMDRAKVDKWQAIATDTTEPEDPADWIHPRLPPEGYEAVGPWEPYGLTYVPGEGLVRDWRRPLRKVVTGG